MEVSEKIADQTGRILRKLARSKVQLRQFMVARGVNKQTGEVKKRKVTRRSNKIMKYGRGWISVRNGPAVAEQIACYLCPDREDPRLVMAIMRDSMLTGAEQYAIDQVKASLVKECRKARREAEDYSDFLANWSSAKAEMGC